MHPILFHIPLPHSPLKFWWGLAAVVAISLVYGLLAQRRGNREGALWSFGLAVAAGVLAVVLRDKTLAATELPIFSYGVMLGISLIVGWYLTLGLAEREGLPKETMANCYVITALAALIGARVLYVVTNLNEFYVTPPGGGEPFFSLGTVFAMRTGGLAVYGGFLGGLLGSWAYLAKQKLPLLPWADVAVPSLASGLFITRIGCYLFGCDFGKPLSDDAPGFLKTLGTFPHWSGPDLAAGKGSPAYELHAARYEHTDLYARLVHDNHSLPVHPTQIYESLAGLAILGLLLWQRRHQKFRGQIFFLFVCAYGFARYVLEIVRDDTDRGNYGPVMSEHVLLPLGLLVLSIAFVFGVALGIENAKARTAARVAAFLPPIIAYAWLKPATFGSSVNAQLSTSQIIAVVSAVIVAYYYAKLWQEAMLRPRAAMALNLPPEFQTTRKPPAVAAREASRDENDDEDEDDVVDERDGDAARTDVAAPVAKKKRASAELADKTEEMRMPDPEPTEEMRLGDLHEPTAPIQTREPTENIMATLREATEPMPVPAPASSKGEK